MTGDYHSRFSWGKFKNQITILQPLTSKLVELGLSSCSFTLLTSCVVLAVYLPHSQALVPLTSSKIQVSSVQSLNCVQLCDPMNRSMPGLPAHHQLPGLFKLTSIELMMPSNHLILCRPLLLLPPIPPSIRVFSKESTLRIRWPKYWSFSFSISPSNDHLGLISFRMDWLNLLAVQGTLKSLLQHDNSKASKSMVALNIQTDSSAGFFFHLFLLVGG